MEYSNYSHGFIFVNRRGNRSTLCYLCLNTCACISDKLLQIAGFIANLIVLNLKHVFLVKHWPCPSRRREFLLNSTNERSLVLIGISRVFFVCW